MCKIGLKVRIKITYLTSTRRDKTGKGKLVTSQIGSITKNPLRATHIEQKRDLLPSAEATAASQPLSENSIFKY